jgi:hypothetical protein
MAKLSKDTAHVEQFGPVEDRTGEVGDYTIDFLRFGENIDATPLFKGLPGDRCTSPHWGYVFKGRLTFRFADHEETFEPGDAFYVQPGHVPVIEAGCEYVQFSPTDEIKAVEDVMTANMRAAGIGG